jgi:hypothetical protein
MSWVKGEFIVPQGWRLVPVEATSAMVKAGVQVPCDPYADSDEAESDDYRKVYRAMLAAAPSPEPDHSEDNLKMVSVPRELLEEIVELHRCRGVVLIIHVEQLAELLAGGDQ